ncbi:unnamed protein product [Paramecium sonneborni]|uniref:Transmembrane protein n=1 Tax=Paramecium sonneborni TaxID=65129 RepID=A0A8S1NPQ9_9CILI|nr:unnamed protein product [Paramecium sonneborni]
MLKLLSLLKNSQLINDLSLCDNKTNSVSLDVQEIISNFLFGLVTLAILMILIFFIIIINKYKFSHAKKLFKQEFISNKNGLEYNSKIFLINVIYQAFIFLFIKSLWIQIRSFWIYCINRSIIIVFLKLNYGDIAILFQGFLILSIYNDTLQLGLRQQLQKKPK